MPAAKDAQPISPLVADLSLFLVTVGWGATFIVVKTAVQNLPPFPFLALRFGLAFISLLPFLWLQRGSITRSALAKSMFVGIFLFFGYVTQTIGLQYTTASNAGFITGMNVVIVPFITAFYHKKLPSKTVLFGTAVAAIGLAFMSIGDNFTINSGDPIVLIGAFCFAAHIFLVGRFAPAVNATVLSAFQILTVSVLSGLGTFAFPQGRMVLTGYVWFGLVLTAVLCTSFAFFVQSKMQQFTSAAHTALIFSAEPVISSLFAYLLAGEVLSPRGYAGAALVLASILVAEFSSIRFNLTRNKLAKGPK